MFRMCVLLLIVSLSFGSAKTFTKCSLAKYLKRLGVSRSQLHHWVCMAKHESNFNTAAIGRNRNGSRDHGIFQINDYWNCDPRNGRKTKNGCGRPCSDFRNSDLSDDVACIKKLYREWRRTFRFSYAWRKFCSNVGSSYLTGCGI